MDIKTARNYKLSDHFTLFEMIDTVHVDLFPDQMEITDKEILNLKRVCENVLEPLREHLGEPITINSGWRSQALNKKIGGSPSSQHCSGEAVDFVCPNMSDAFAFIRKNLQFDQLINEKGLTWIHVSYNRSRNRYESLNFDGHNYTRI